MKKIFCLLTLMLLLGCQSAKQSIDDSNKYVRILSDQVTLYFNLQKINEYAESLPEEYVVEPDNSYYPFDNHKSYDFYIEGPDYELETTERKGMDRFLMIGYAWYGIHMMLRNHEAIIIDNQTKKPVEYNLNLYTGVIGGEGFHSFETYQSNGRLLLSSGYDGIGSFVIPDSQAINLGDLDHPIRNEEE